MAVQLMMIRHAQASFGAADYDQLSRLGLRQAQILGDRLAEVGFRPALSFIGTQRRHRQTLDALADGMWCELPFLAHDGLNEFDGNALIAAWRTEQSRPDPVPDDRAAHFSDLRRAMLDWQAGRVAGAPESWEVFHARVLEALEYIRSRTEQARGRDAVVLAVSSGGPISAIVAAAMQAPPSVQADLQMQMYNCAISCVVLSGRGPILQTFNGNLLATRADAARFVTHS